MRDDAPRSPVLKAGMKSSLQAVNSDHRIGRRMSSIAVIGVLILILVVASIRYLHPPAFALLLSMSDGIIWHQRSSQGHLWQPYKQKQRPEKRQVSTSLAAASPSIVFPTTSSASNSPVTTIATTSAPTPTTIPATTAAAANLPVPTIPSSPPTLPTLFPHPFDSDLTQNFSSTSCFKFFAEMTAMSSFLSCRPFSFLQDNSNSFSEAQNNLTLMNTIIWGTCNTTLSEDQCTTNMGLFADALSKACVQDLQDQNQMAVSALRDLQAYSLMRHAGCLTDLASNTYCYLDALNNAGVNANIYFYSLPLAIPVPNTTKMLCTSCTRDLMSLYSEALSNSTLAPALTGLQQTYGSAAKLAVAQCGTAYADKSVASAVPAALLRDQWTGLAVLILGMMLQILS